MKGVITKIISILVIAMMVINSSLLTIISVAIDEVEKIIDESKIDVNYELNIRKYVNYEVGEEKGLMVQTYLKDGIEYQEGQERVSIKSTNVVINAPKVNGEYPQKAEVLVDSTKLTNGDSNGKDVNYSYNNEKGELTIFTENKADENGKFYSEYSVEDKNEYKLNFYYSANCYDDKNTKTTLEFTGKVEFELTKDEEITVNKDILQSFDVSENISGLISTEVTTSDIYNGYIESNIVNDTKYRTEYTEKVTVDIDYKEISDEIVLIENDNFVKNDKEIETEDIVYKSTKINKNDVLSKLGENGTLKITNESGEVLVEINKDTETKEDGSVEITYEKEVKSIKVNMSKPVSLGRILIENTKQIKETMRDVNVNKIKTKYALKANNNFEIINEETHEVEKIEKQEKYEYLTENEIEIKQANTTIEASVNKTQLTNEFQNEIKLNVKLGGNSEDKKLLKNTIVKVDFPKEVEKIIVGNSQLLYGNGVTVKETEIKSNNEGKLSIICNLSGEQEDYLDKKIGVQTELNFNLIVILKKEIENKNENITIECTNENIIDSKIEKISKDLEISIIDYENADKIKQLRTQALNNEEVTENIKLDVSATRANDNLKNNDIVYEGEYIKYNINLKNTTDEIINNVKIKATIPEGTKYGELNAEFDKFEGKYEYEFDENLLEKEISVGYLNPGEEYSTYYEIQVKDLEDGVNSKEILTDIKTYIGTDEINNCQLTNVVKNAEAKVFLKADMYQRTILWNYIANVESEKEVELKINLPKEFKFRLGWNAADSKEFSEEQITISEDNVLTVKVSSGIYYFTGSIISSNIKNKNESGCTELIATASAKVDDVEYKSNENRIQYLYPTVSIKMTSDNEGEEVRYGEEINYKIVIKSIGRYNIVSPGYASVEIKLQDYLPEELDPESITYNYFEEVNEKGEKLDYLSEDSLTNGYVPTGIFSEKSETKDISGIITDSEGNRNPNIDLSLIIPFGKEIVIDVKAKAGFLYKKTEIENKAEIYGNLIDSKNSNTIKHIILPYDYAPSNPDDPSNPDEPSNPNDPSNPDEPSNPNNPSNPDDPSNPNNPSNPDTPANGDEENKYKISGTVWIDDNEDSERQMEEEKIRNVPVMLVDMKDSGNVKEKVYTNENGNYEFSKLEAGEYIVLFRYDTDKFKPTEYKKSGISNKYNSDAVDQEITLNGEKILVAATDIFNVNSDVTDIDLGLVKNKIFDFKLEKTISKVTVNAGEQTKIYDYNNIKLAKVEINRKKIDGAIITVEYNLTVTNEGELAGNIDEITDYIPEGFELSENSKATWVKKEDGTVTNNTLTNKLIDAGKSESVKITITKKLSSTELGTFKNSAEITKAYNNKKINDIDSVYGNKNEDEDDYSSAEVIVSIGTGKIVISTLLVLIGLILIAFIISHFNKNKINKKILIGLILCMAFTPIICSGETTKGGWWYKDTYPIPNPNPNSPPATTYYAFCPTKTTDSYGNKVCIHGYGNRYGSTHFTGGIDNNGGFCQDSGRAAKTGTYSFDSYYGDTAKVQSIIPNTEFSLSINNNITPTLVLSGNNYILGPFQIYVSEYSSSYTTTVYDMNGTAVNGISYCDSNGTGINPTGSDTFYIKIPQGNLGSKISRVVSTGSKSGKETEIDFYAGVLLYKYNDKSQRVSGPEWAHQITYWERTVETTHSVTWTNIVSTGDIKITKRDADNSSSLSGAQFKVTGPNYNQTVTVYNGETTLSGLLVGNYNIEETTAPSGYNLSLQGDLKKSTSVSAGQTATVAYTNRRFGNLVIKKIDANTGKVLNGVKFKIWKDGYYVEKTTDSSGIIRLNNLQMGTYYIQEIAISSDMAGYYEIDSRIYGVNLKNNVTEGDTNITITNKQLYINISGYVWEDKVDAGKNSVRDNLYASSEPLLSGITVKLKNKNGGVIATKTTDARGTYIFTKVKIAELENYYVEFEYNGLKYQSVVANLGKANGSKAIEKTTDRTNFNNSYASITGGNEKGSSTIGYSRNQNGTITNNLTYKNGKYVSTLVQNMKYTTRSANGIVTAKNGSTGVTIHADTKTAGTKFTWSAGVKEISNINLGISERNQADLAIATDLNTIDMAINGYSHTYSYDRRIKANGIDIFSEVQKWNKTDEQKQQENSNYPRSYTRSLYKNYVYASGTDGNGILSEQNKLQINLTYKIQVKNESSLYMTANEIVNYYDKTLDYVSSYYMDTKGNKVNINWTTKNYKNGYKQIRTSGIKDIKIEPKSSVTIYLTMKKNTIAEWKTKNELKESTYNITEITSYSSYTKNGNNYSYYAAIDKDSAPDNIKVGTTSTYEDETDSAPVVEFIFDEPRTISGYVFEDSTSNNLNTNGERKGDGKYNASNDGYVENVKVELITKSNNQVAYIYPDAVTKLNFDAKKAVYTTTKEGKGYYEFVGIIPNEYYIKFTYGDGTVIYKKSGEKVNGTAQDYKSTILTSEQMKNAYGVNEFNVSKNPRWYQENSVKGYSTAVDDYATRQNINKNLSTITYGVSTGYDKKESGYANLQTMTARTPDINIAIENVNSETTKIDENRTRLYDNINFGIVERPRQSLTVTKEINYIKMTLATGSVLLEGNPQTDNLPYVTYPQRGILKIEADSEITQGATLEVGYIINVKNNSEIDYDSESYYKYGTVTSKDKVVNLTINSIVDYLDDELKTSYTTDGNETGVWKLKTSTSIKDLIADNVYSTIKNKNNILVNNWNIVLQPTGSKNITVTASKVISAEDEMAFENYVEILSYSNSVGRFYGEQKDGKWKHMTPGNYAYGAVSSTHEGDDNAYDNANRAKISIVPSTGDNNIIYYVIGISSLIVIAGGVVLIKKFVV